MPTGRPAGTPSTGRRPAPALHLVALFFVVSSCALTGVPATLAAQSSPLAVELHGGLTRPVDAFREELEEVDDPTGDLGFGVRLVYRGGRGLGFYAGFSQLRFECGSAPCRGEKDVVSTGWELGIRWTFDAGPVQPFLQAGGFFPRVEARTDRSPVGSGVGSGEGSGDGSVEVSDLAAGGEVGLGIALPLAERIAFRPFVRYQAVDARFPSSGLLRFRHLFFEAALGFGF